MMNESAAEVIRSRRTIHEFEPGVVIPPEVVEQAIAHAVCAPNHRQTQPWRFYLLGPQTSEALCVLNADRVRAQNGEQAAEAKLRRWRAMPGWLLLTCVLSADEVRLWEDYAACCCAAQNLMLYLWERGVGVKWSTGGLTRDPRFYEVLKIDPGAERVVGLFWYGTPAQVPDAAQRRSGEFVARRP